MPWGSSRQASGSSAFEVRCPRCDVSFPAETRVCVHCGGRTAAAGTVPIFEPNVDYDLGPVGGDGTGRAPAPIEATDESPFVFGDAGVGSTGPDDRGLDPEDEPPSFARSILGNLGGLVWVILLIAFSIARSCGE